MDSSQSSSAVVFHQDQRRYPRRAYAHEVGVLCKGEYSIARGLDLGEGGLSFSSDLVFAQGMKLVLSFQIPMGSFLVVRAQVVRMQKDPESNRMMHGCSFLNVKFDNKREIRSFVSARS